MTMKLFRVRATMDILVMAPDHQSACHTARSQAVDEVQTVAVLASPDDMPPQWTPSTLVYQSRYHADDMTAGEALAMCHKVTP
jgi:hypothetical protein